MGEPLVTVVISSYNRPRLIRDALDSVLVQTWPNAEIIVADDWSDGAVMQVLGEYRECVQVVTPMGMFGPTNEERQYGQRTSVCINVAMSYVKGEFVCFLPDDDMLTPRSIEVRARYLMDHPEVNVVYGRLESCKASDPVPGMHWMGVDEGAGYTAPNGLIGQRIHARSAIIDWHGAVTKMQSDPYLFGRSDSRTGAGVVTCEHDRNSFYSAEPIARMANKVDHGMPMVRRLPGLPGWPEHRTAELVDGGYRREAMLMVDIHAGMDTGGENFDCPDAGWFYRLELAGLGPFHSVPDVVVVKRYGHGHGHRTDPTVRE